MPKKDDGYVMHDGVLLSLDKLVSMAKLAGSYALAEHYIVSILYHAIVSQQPQLAKVCDEIREHYQLRALFEGSPVTEQPEDKPVVVLPGASPASAWNMPRTQTIEEIVKQKYARMKSLDQTYAIKICLSLLWQRHQDLFENKECWIGVYLVVRDRLDLWLQKTEFYNIIFLATPDFWPKDLRISESTMSNFTRRFTVDPNKTRYYDMGKNNPWGTLCDCFWEILKEVFRRYS